MRRCSFWGREGGLGVEEEVWCYLSRDWEGGLILICRSVGKTCMCIKYKAVDRNLRIGEKKESFHRTVVVS